MLSDEMTGRAVFIAGAGCGSAGLITVEILGLRPCDFDRTAALAVFGEGAAARCIGDADPVPSGPGLFLPGLGDNLFCLLPVRSGQCTSFIPCREEAAVQSFLKIGVGDNVR